MLVELIKLVTQLSVFSADFSLYTFLSPVKTDITSLTDLILFMHRLLCVPYTFQKANSM